jgi:hypothetical protein
MRVPNYRNTGTTPTQELLLESPFKAVQCTGAHLCSLLVRALLPGGLLAFPAQPRDLVLHHLGHLLSVVLRQQHPRLISRGTLYTQLLVKLYTQLRVTIYTQLQVTLYTQLPVTLYTQLPGTSHTQLRGHIIHKAAGSHYIRSCGSHYRHSCGSHYTHICGSHYIHSCGSHYTHSCGTDLHYFPDPDSESDPNYDEAGVTSYILADQQSPRI